MSKTQNLKVLRHIKNGMKGCDCLSTLIDKFTNEHILQFINSDGACKRRGGSHPEQPKAGGCARTIVQNNIILFSYNLFLKMYAFLGFCTKGASDLIDVTDIYVKK